MPSFVGENSTVSWIEELGAIVLAVDVCANWVNGSVNALGPLVVGGVDLVIKSGKPPWSPRAKLRVALDPTATSPKSSTLGAVLICDGGTAEPVIATPKLP